MRVFGTKSQAVVVVAALGMLAAIAVAVTHAAEPGATGAAWPRGQYAGLDRLPDWGGVWVLNRGGRPAPGQPTQPKLKGDYLVRFEAWQKETRANNGVARRETSNCMPPGMPRMMGTAQYPLEFLFTPGRVTIHHEAWMQWRNIYTDGRGHPDDLEPGVFGHSIGRWEGGALVVETVGIKTITELATGMKHSDKLKVTERFELAPGEPDTLVLDMTLEDPEALVEPFRQRYTWRRERDWALMEFICAENDRNPVNATGVTGFE